MMQKTEGAQPVLKHMIPPVRELRFFAQITLGVLFAAFLGIGVVFMFFNRELGDSFAGAIATMHQLADRITPILMLAIAVQVAVSAIVVYLAALRYSHKISGPMYRVRYVLREYLQGRFSDRITFRQGDFLTPVADQLTELLRQQQADDRRIENAMDLLREADMSNDTERRQCLEHLQRIVDEMERGDA